MPPVEIPEEILHKLIDAGRSDDLSIMRSCLSPQEQRYYGHLMRLRPEPWLNIVDSLSIDDLVALIKCLTVVEYVFEDWKGGSVSPVIWLFRKLSNIDPALEDVVADWVLAHTSNDYLPYGSMNLGAKSLSEYSRIKQLAYEKKQARHRKE